MLLSLKSKNFKKQLPISFEKKNKKKLIKIEINNKINLATPSAFILKESKHNKISISLKKKIIFKCLAKPFVYKNTWARVLPNSCKVNPLYFTSTYPWTYRMSSKISNYYFGKKPIQNLLTFNINLPVKHQLRGVYFFSNYDNTNYGKLHGKNIPLYRLYPSLFASNLVQSNHHIYQVPVTNRNLAYLPLTKYYTNQSDIKLSGNWWFIDNLIPVFLRKYHNVYAHNVMSREIDCVISMFDSKLAPIFTPLSAAYNLQRTFTLGLSPQAQVFMPQRYLRSSHMFSRRCNLWSNKYYNFWNRLNNSNLLNHDTVKLITSYWAKQLTNTVFHSIHIGIVNKLYNNFDNSNVLSYLTILANKNINFSSQSALINKLKKRVNNLYNNIFKPINTNKLYINIKQGTSLVSNLIFSTKRLAVINARTLYHYYPYYTKKPYGTGIKQNIIKKSNRFNKTKISALNQVLKLTYIMGNKCTIFNKVHQLARWISYNNNEHIFFDNKSSLLNVLTLSKNQKYLPLVTSNRLGLVSYKLKHQHYMPTFNKLQNSFNKLQLYYYLTHYKNNIPWYKQLKRNKKWFIHNKQISFGIENVLFPTIILMSLIYSLNFNVQKYLNYKYSIPYQDILQEIDQPDKLNWLKSYLIPQHRQHIYTMWADSTIESQKTASLPAVLLSQNLLVNGINEWLNIYPQFYYIYNLFNNYLNFMKSNINQKKLFALSQPSVLDKTLVIRSCLNKFSNTKQYVKYINYFKNLYKKSMIYEPEITISKVWSPPSIVKAWELTLDQWKNIVKKKKALWFSSYNNVLNVFQQREKQIYLLYNRELDAYMTKYKSELIKIEIQQFKQKRWLQRKLEQQKLEQQRLEQQKLEQQKLEQQRLEQQRLNRNKLAEHRQSINKQLQEMPLGARVSRALWITLDDKQRTTYHVNQKRLKKLAKQTGKNVPNNRNKNSPN